MKLVTSTSIVVALAGLMGPGLANAAESCAPLSIEADGHVLARWPELPERLRSTFEAREDIDACARVKVALRGKFHVEVALPDGRVAERVVSDVEDVVQVLEALLVVPPPSPSSSQEPIEARVVPSSEPTDSPPLPARALVGEEPPGSDRLDPMPLARGPQKRSSEHAVGVELSALTGARVGGRPVSVGIGALAFADVTGWLVGIGGRFDRYTTSTQQTRAIELAALGGRRFRWNETALDLVAGPAVVMIDTGDRDAPEVVLVRPHVVAPAERPSTLPRLVLGARLHFRARSTLRTFVGVDGEVGPAGAPLDGNAPLPVATIGLALGATMGTR